MSTATVIFPSESITRYVNEYLKKSEQALFAVAYISRAAVKEIEKSLRAALRRGLQLDVVFRHGDYFTDPGALDLLHELGEARGAGRISLYPANDARFHAKFFGFRTNSKAAPVVLLGSSNLTGKALGFGSGEVNVLLESSPQATEVWDLMLGYCGDVIGPTWIDAYRARWKAVRKARSKATVKAEKATPPVPVDWRSGPLYLLNIAAEDDEQDWLDKASDARKLSRPGDLYCRSKHERDLVPEHRIIMGLDWGTLDDKGAPRSLRAVRIMYANAPITVSSGKKKGWIVRTRNVRGIRTLHLNAAQSLRLFDGKKWRIRDFWGHSDDATQRRDELHAFYDDVAAIAAT